jgi:hypothetical protein
MKMFKVWMGLLVAALVLVLVPATMAQEPTFGLSQEDFAAFTAANAGSATATSAAFNFTMTASVTGVPDAGDIAADLAGTGLYDMVNGLLDLNVTGSVTAQGSTLPVNFSVRALDETLFFNLDGTSWMGLTGEEFETFAEGFSQSAPLDITALTDGDSAELGQAMAALSTVDPSSLINISRNGNLFTTNVNIAGFTSSPEFAELVTAAAMMDTSGELSSMSEGEIAAMSSMVGVLFQNSSLKLDQYVGADGLVERSVLDLNMTLDPASIGETGDAIGILFNFDVSLSQYNGAFSLTAPEGAVMMSEAMGS